MKIFFTCKLHVYYMYYTYYMGTKCFIILLVKYITWQLHVYYMYYIYYICYMVYSFTGQIYYMAITQILHLLHLLHMLHGKTYFMFQQSRMTFGVMYGQATCSMSMRMFVEGHPPGLLLVFYRLWDQIQSGMSVRVIQSQ